MHIVDPALKKFGTERHGQYIDAVNELGSYRKAAKKFGVTPDAVRINLNALAQRATVQGYDPVGYRGANLDAPFVLKGFSRMRDLRTGEDIVQWDKVKVDDQLRAQAILRAFETAADPLPRLPPIRRPKHTLPDLLNLYTFTDFHLGMRAWKKEGGKTWDLPTAERVILDGFRYMMETAPAAGTGFINQLGDFFHSDGLLPVTPTSGHVLDQSAQYQEMVEAGVRILRYMIDMALERHDKVVVLMAEGNHDLASSIWLRTLLKALYEKEKRVEVIDAAQPFYAYQFGGVMLGFHHGHKVKNEQLPSIFASRYRAMWGGSERVYIHVGHRHHLDQKDHAGARVIQHPTLAAADSHSARGGYDLDGQEAQVFTYHRSRGQVLSTFFTPEMLEAA